ncbi:L,D-transpeptidase family protein [Paludibacterium sp. THUN1379]|nr:L,D-transpeptidase family protein [Paludibacterium sp. THUN1379]
MVFALVAHAAVAHSSWIDIDTRQQTLTVLDGEHHPLAQFDDIAIGSGGVVDVHRQGDHTTPRGHFHVVSIRPSATFKTFLLLDYPQQQQADLAWQRGEISQQVRDDIVAAAASGRLPPQDSPLGGAIGIHGLGRGSPDIQQRYNWTSGCIALTNRQIRRLARLVYPGMSVVIH